MKYKNDVIVNFFSYDSKCYAHPLSCATQKHHLLIYCIIDH